MGASRRIDLVDPGSRRPTSAVGQARYPVAIRRLPGGYPVTTRSLPGHYPATIEPLPATIRPLSGQAGSIHL
jgi:hypothetical protein